MSSLYKCFHSLEEHCLQKQLGLHEDEFGILQCHGQYANADISEETKLLLLKKKV